jgi:hypothetical protein
MTKNDGHSRIDPKPKPSDRWTRRSIDDHRKGEGLGIHGWWAGMDRLADRLKGGGRGGSSILIPHFLRDVWRRIHALVSRTSDHGESPVISFPFSFFLFLFFLRAE